MIKRLDLPGPIGAAWIERDRRHLSPSYTRPYPFVMERGQGANVWDPDGHRFLDFCAGIAVCSTGHSHPKVVQAIQDQAARFIHMSGTDFYYGPEIELAERLNHIAPMSGNTRVFFTNSGAESIEAAFKLARYHSRRPRTVAYISAFHGRTMGALSLTASKAVQREGFAPLVPGVTHVPYPYCYRCPFGRSHPACDLYCAHYIEETILKSYCPPNEVAALFAEPIQGEGGYVVPPPGYWQRIRELCDKYGILLVMDEIQSGLGRTGKLFAIEHWDTEPDIVALAKGIASGMPLGAIVAREEVMTWPPGAHGTTYGGNPVCCAAALATLDLIEEGLAENAARQGDYMLDALHEMQTRYAIVGDVRGKGLMIAVEWVQDRESKEPAPELRNRIIQECYLRGMLVLGCGLNNLRFSPPLSVTRAEVDEALEILESALEACTQTVR